MNETPKIPHVAWRRGRPRFEPSKTLRAMGYSGSDLKQDNGEWMTAGQALDWSRAFAQELNLARKLAAPRQKAATPQPRPVVPPLPSYPLKQLFADWLHPEKNPDLQDLKPKTIYEYGLKQAVLQKHAPEIWAASAGALTKAICKGLYADLRKRASLPQAVGTMRVLGIVLQWGMDTGALPDMLVNPAHKLKMKKPDPRVRFATTAEIDHMVATADKMGRFEIGDMITLGVWSGQRQGDRLEFEMAGRTDGRITLRQAKTGVIVSIKEAPELTARLEASRKRRALATTSTQDVVEIKQARERRAAQSSVMNRIILDEHHWKPFQKRHYARTFEDVRKAAKIGMASVSDLTDQDLRDTAVTWLATAGATIPEICAITGHTFGSANEILKHYLSLHAELADSAIAKMVIWHEAKRGKTAPDR